MNGEKVKILVPICGGKDSQACLKLALENCDAKNVRGLFCDTQFEHPLTYQHVEKIRDMYGIQIDTVCGGSVIEKTLKYKRFPGGGARHCTDELKIRETKIYCTNLAKSQGSIRHPNTSDYQRDHQADGGFEVWYGMRSEESHEREKRYEGKTDFDLYAPHEVLPNKYPKYLEKLGVMFRIPIINWTKKQVIDFVGVENLNPLYKYFDRVGCFPCLAAGDDYKVKAFNHDDFGREQFIKIEKVERQINKSVFTSIGGKKRNDENQGCLLCAM